MRVLNEQILTTYFLRALTERGLVSSDYAEWFKTSALKSLLKDESFIKEFAVQVQTKRLSLFQDQGNTAGKLTFFVYDADGNKLPIYWDDPYAESDAARGLLYYFLPRRQALSWIVKHYPVLMEARDFFESVKFARPNEDLRKYTLESLPRHLETWRLNETTRRLQEAAREQERLLAALHNAQELDQLVRDNLKAKWARMVEDTDFRVVSKFQEQTVLQLLTPRALDWEASAKGNCIDGSSYKNRLSDPRTCFLSTRLTEDLSSPLFTVELSKGSDGWEIVQLEHWGYMFLGKKNTLPTYVWNNTRSHIEGLCRGGVPGIKQQLVFNLKTRG